MPSTNLDLVRSIYASWERGDYSLVEWAYPEIEVVAVDGPDPGGWTGLPAVVGAFRDHLNAWGEYRAKAEEYRELDGERVLVLTHVTARGRTSGLEGGNRGANVFHVWGGKVTKLVLYWDRDRALADLSLTPDTGT